MASYSYRMIYVDGAVVAAALAEATGRRAAMPFFCHSVVDDAVLAESMQGLHRVLEQPAAELVRESLADHGAGRAARRHGRAAPGGCGRTTARAPSRWRSTISRAILPGISLWPSLRRSPVSIAFICCAVSAGVWVCRRISIDAASSAPRRLMLAGECAALAGPLRPGFADDHLHPQVQGGLWRYAGRCRPGADDVRSALAGAGSVTVTSYKAPMPFSTALLRSTDMTS